MLAKKNLSTDEKSHVCVASICVSMNEDLAVKIMMSILYI